MDFALVKHALNSAFVSFEKRFNSLSPQQQKIAVIVAIVFSCLTSFYLIYHFYHYCFKDKIKVKALESENLQIRQTKGLNINQKEDISNLLKNEEKAKPLLKSLNSQYQSETVLDNLLDDLQDNSTSSQNAKSQSTSASDNIKELIQQNGLALKDLPDLQNNSKIVELAIKQNPDALEFASNLLKNNPSLVKLAVQLDGLTLRFASLELQNDPGIVLLAVQQDGLALIWASERLKDQENIVKAAFQENKYALLHASQRLQKKIG